MTTSRSPITSSLRCSRCAATLNLWSPTGNGGVRRTASPGGVSVSVNESDGPSPSQWSTRPSSGPIGSRGRCLRREPLAISLTVRDRREPGGPHLDRFRLGDLELLQRLLPLGVSAAGTSRSTALRLGTSARRGARWVSTQTTLCSPAGISSPHARACREGLVKARPSLATLKSHEVPGRSMHSARRRYSSCASVRSNFNSIVGPGPVAERDALGAVQAASLASGRPPRPRRCIAIR